MFPTPARKSICYGVNRLTGVQSIKGPETAFTGGGLPFYRWGGGAA